MLRNPRIGMAMYVQWAVGAKIRSSVVFGPIRKNQVFRTSCSGCSHFGLQRSLSFGHFGPRSYHKNFTKSSHAEFPYMLAFYVTAFY